MLTRITGQKIPCVKIHVYQIIKNRRPGPYNPLRHADNRKYFSLSDAKSRGSTHVLLADRSGKNLGDVLAERKVTLFRLMN